jgi:hypothetical protein
MRHLAMLHWSSSSLKLLLSSSNKVKLGTPSSLGTGES